MRRRRGVRCGEAAAAVPLKGGAELAKAAACMACHGIVGPGFREIAAKYRGAAGAQ